MKSDSADKETLLSDLLSEQGFEITGQVLFKENGIAEIYANKLYPIAISETDILYVFVPVTLQITLNKDKGIQNMTGDELSQNAIADATRFVHTLIKNNQLDGFEGQTFPHATHYIDVSKPGLQVVRRRSFRSSYH